MNVSVIVVATESLHRPSLWLFLALFVPYVLLITAGNVFVARWAGGPAWHRWREQARHLSIAQRFGIWLALSRRKRVSDERLIPAMLARIELARALLRFTKGRTFTVTRWAGGLLALTFIPISLLAEHHSGEPAWLRWYLVAMSLFLGIGLIVGYPRLISWMERRLDRAERANQVEGTPGPDP